MTKSMMFGLGTMLLTSVVLHGCGGGGDSPSPTPTPASQAPIDPNLTVPVQTAFANIVNKGLNQSFTISGSVDNSTPANPAPPTPIGGNGQFTSGAATPATLCGFSVSQAAQVVTGTTIANGVSTPFATTSTTFYRSDNTIVGTQSAGEFFLFTPVTFPATVRAGGTGVTGTGTEVNANCDQVSFGSNITGAYSVASDTANSLLVTFVENEKNPFSSSETKSSTVYRIDTSGNVSLVSVTATKSFLASVFQTLIFTF
ncbi:MAG: hypothetical protein E8D47_02345 [Nitrospira sp.]|nr:MAG: hypothetical protein E8D47_02345 [Nitrospira sp.]